MMKGVHMAGLLSVNVGRPREIAWCGKTWSSTSSAGPRRSRAEVHLVNIGGVKQW